MGILSALFGRKKVRAETAEEIADRMNREHREWCDREQSLAILSDGRPNPGWYHREAEFLCSEGRDDQAEDILEEGIELSSRCGMTSAHNSLTAYLSSIRRRRTADALWPTVRAIIQENPSGVLQTELYRLMPDQDQELLRYACYRLAETGKISREKRGRSYMLRLAEQDKPE